MKLSDWAEKQGIAYLTAYRWFKSGKLPVEAYQSDSGTIIVKDESEDSEQVMANNIQNNDIMSIFLKKTVEFSKNNATVEDFAAYIISNFSLKMNTKSEGPKYSRIKPNAEDVQKHFQQFLKPKGEKPKQNMFVPEGDIFADEDGLVVAETPETPEEKDLAERLSTALASKLTPDIRLYNSVGTESMITRNVDLTPQSINYTSSTQNHAFSSPIEVEDKEIQPSSTISNSDSFGFKPTQKEVALAHKTLEQVATEIHQTAVKARRGRKSTKGKK